MASITNLSEDLLLLIFLKLPTQTLCLFQLVCKTWNSIISSSIFVDLYLTSATENPRRSFRIYSNYMPYCVYENSISSYKFSYKFSLAIQCLVSKANRKIIQSTHDCFKVVGAIHGVICFEAVDLLRIAVLWNPVIHKYVSVPTQPLDPGFRYVLGFGFCSSKNDFKLIRVRLMEGNCIGKSVMQLSKNYEVFSVKDGSWRNRVIANDVVISSSNHRYMDPKYASHSCFINGNIYWPVINQKHSGDGREARYRCSLLVFDCEREEFDIMKLPDSFDCASRKLSVWRYEGKLSVLKYMGLTEEYELWVIKEYGWHKLVQDYHSDFLFVGFGDFGSDDVNDSVNDKVNDNVDIYAIRSDAFEESMYLADLKGRAFSSYNKCALFPDDDQIIVGHSDASYEVNGRGGRDRIVVECHDSVVDSFETFLSYYAF